MHDRRNRKGVLVFVDNRYSRQSHTKEFGVELVSLSGKAVALIIVFTIVETVVLTAWLFLLGVPVNTGAAAGGVAAIVLFVGLLVEHLLAGISNKV